jgi:predicted Zn-dependent protease
VKSIGSSEDRVAFQWTQATVLELSRIKQALDDDPKKPDLHWRYGAALALFGHIREAVQELQDAIHLDSRYALYHITLGRIYERAGQHADAVREFQAALALRGSFYDAVFSGWAQAHLAQLQAH